MPKAYITEAQRLEAERKRKDERFKDIVLMRMTHSGLTRTELAKRTGLCTHTVGKYLSNPELFLGVTRAMVREIGLTPEEIGEVV